MQAGGESRTQGGADQSMTGKGTGSQQPSVVHHRQEDADAKEQERYESYKSQRSPFNTGRESLVRTVVRCP